MLLKDFCKTAKAIDGKTLNGKVMKVNWDVVRGPDHGFHHGNEVWETARKLCVMHSCTNASMANCPEAVSEYIGEWNNPTTKLTILTAAFFHDCGLWIGDRKTHHDCGADLIAADPEVFSFQGNQFNLKLSIMEIADAVRKHRRPLEDLENTPAAWLVCYGDKYSLLNPRRSTVRCVVSKLIHEHGIRLDKPHKAEKYMRDNAFIDECVDHLYRKTTGPRVLGNSYIASNVRAESLIDRFWDRPEKEVREGLREYAKTAFRTIGV